jgi:hypothetical protein
MARLAGDWGNRKASNMRRAMPDPFYLTNLPVSVPPGIVALLYKSRGNVEKVFDEFKNKLGETKSWTSTANSKTCQARLLCRTHNLMTLMEEQIFREAGIRNVIQPDRVSAVPRQVLRAGGRRTRRAAPHRRSATVPFIRSESQFLR